MDVAERARRAEAPYEESDSARTEARWFVGLLVLAIVALAIAVVRG